MGVGQGIGIMTYIRPGARINFVNDVVYGIAYLLGIDPAQDLLKDHARAWVSAINSRVRYGWEFWDWPELMVTEERALRQVWYTDVTYSSSQGENSEIYYIPNEKYYRAIEDPPIGTLPTNILYFHEIAFADLDKHIAYEQHGKQDIGQIYGVNNSSPRTNTPSIQWGTAPSGLGLDVSQLTGKTVWITYKPRPPQFTSSTYSNKTDYVRGDVTLDLVSGNCFLALSAGTDQALNLPSYWLLQEFPYILTEYVKYATAADMSDDLPTKDRYLAEAETFLTREVDKLTEQGEVHKYGPKKSYRMPLGLSAYTQIYWNSVTS